MKSSGQLAHEFPIPMGYHQSLSSIHLDAFISLRPSRTLWFIRVLIFLFRRVHQNAVIRFDLFFSFYVTSVVLVVYASAVAFASNHANSDRRQVVAAA